MLWKAIHAQVYTLPVVDWSKCPDAESIPDRCGGAWCVKGTRVMVQGILDNAEECSAEEIAGDIYPSITVEVVRRILAFAGGTPLDYSDIPPLDDDFFSRQALMTSPEETQRRRAPFRRTGLEGLRPAPRRKRLEAHIRGEIEAGDLVTAYGNQNDTNPGS